MSDTTHFFAMSGQPVCYSPDGEHLYLWDGNSVGYITNEKVYAYSGKLVGWFYNGWLYDQRNCPALFSEVASGGPAKPAKRAKPAKAARGARPAKGAKQATPARPARSVSWSVFSSEAYFLQN
ncbi:MAG: hypothetical protein JKY60_20440 [Kordiimonadaceae bacterium]|nr:hypothetical protein [Kordiimonadaceae bacterium]MBL4791308.1 hypothetical protein [Kordiimonadaceae bacterium]